MQQSTPVDFYDDIDHRPIFDVGKVTKFYTEKDGVHVKYICTSALGSEAQAMDIFYRETPHPEFGNHYFGLFHDILGNIMITNADRIEDIHFDCIYKNNKYHYSQHRHDYYTVGDVAIDGGRAYTKLVGNVSSPITKFGVRCGQFYEVKGE